MNKQIAALATDEENIVMWDIDTLLLDHQGHPHISVETEALTPKEWLHKLWPDSGKNITITVLQ